MGIKIELNTHRGKLCNNLPILFPIEIFYFNLPLTLFTTYNVESMVFMQHCPEIFLQFILLFCFLFLVIVLLYSFKQHDPEVNKQYMDDNDETCWWYLICQTVENLIIFDECPKLIHALLKLCINIYSLENILNFKLQLIVHKLFLYITYLFGKSCAKLIRKLENLLIIQDFDKTSNQEIKLEMRTKAGESFFLLLLL